MSQSTDDKLANVLINHSRRSIEGCACGWSELGQSHAKHIIEEIRKAGLAIISVSSLETVIDHLADTDRFAPGTSGGGKVTVTLDSKDLGGQTWCI